MGRRRFIPTRDQRAIVAIAAGCGRPHDLICQQIINPATGAAIDGKTLRRVFRAELDKGKVIATSLVAQFLFGQATRPGPQAVTAAIFWLKTQGGWRESTQPIALAEMARAICGAVQEMERMSDGTLDPMDSPAPSPDSAELSAE